ncbi:hypothetical protein [Nonomuraea sp. CA-141351]|uniref:hypothetical protein n=1 Tax=Nonomuraea sp. CA-141351 TaxID=3239996 RepID=UPI003D921EC7
MSFTEHDVHECRRLMIGCRRNQLAIGDILAAEWAHGAAALGEFCERVGLSVTAAKEWRATAAAVTPELLNTCGVFVSYSVLHEGARLRGGHVLDPGYVKLLCLVDDAKTVGIDRINRATYQTVLGTAPPLAAVIDPSARETDGLVGYVTEVHQSPNRDELVQVPVAEEQVTRAELAAEFDRWRAQQAEQRAGRCGERPPAITPSSSMPCNEPLWASAQPGHELLPVLGVQRRAGDEQPQVAGAAGGQGRHRCRAGRRPPSPGRAVRTRRQAASRT